MKLAIYQTSDLHGHIYPTNYVSQQALGLLMAASFIHADEKRYDASLKIDCGDLIQGSLMSHFIHKQAYRENVITKGMEAIGYDVYVLGNHEFNYGLNYLKTAYQPIAHKLLNANIEGLPLQSKPYTIFQYENFRVACIGLTTAFIPNWEQQQNIEGITFHDPVAMYGKYEAELKAQADYIIVCYHGGFEKSVDAEMIPTEALTKENQASELLETFDSINLLLSGHQHRAIMTKVQNVICTQPLPNGQSFSKIIVDTETKESTYELIQTKDIHIPIYPKYEAIFHKVQTDLEQYFDKEIGCFSDDMQIQDIKMARFYGHPLINFIHEIQFAISHADISVTSLFDTAIGFKKHVSIRDVLINYPYPNTLRVLEINGHQLKEAIEKSATYFMLDGQEIVINDTFLKPKIQSYNYDMFAGLTYEVDLTKPCYQRVIAMLYQGKPMELDKTYRVVMNNYRASNTSIYPSYEGAKIVKEINIDISELMIDYIQEKQYITIDETCNYTFLTHTK